MPVLPLRDPAGGDALPPLHVGAGGGRVGAFLAGVAPLAAALLCAGCETGAPARVEVPVDSAAGEVPFELAGMGEAAVLVPVYLNGSGPYHFVLDTGATFTCLDRRLADSLALPEQRGARGVGAGVRGSGRITIIRIDSLRVGQARAERISACVVDLGHIGELGFQVDGLLGLNFLKEFRLTLDFERDILTLSAP